MKQEHKKIYKVYVKGQLMKEYDNPLQAYTWLHIHRFIGADRVYLFLLRDSKIVVEEKEPENKCPLSDSDFTNNKCCFTYTTM